MESKDSPVPYDKTTQYPAGFIPLIIARMPLQTRPIIANQDLLASPECAGIFASASSAKARQIQITQKTRKNGCFLEKTPRNHRFLADGRKTAPSAPTAPTPYVGALSAPEHEGAPTAPTSCARGVGGESAQVTLTR